jgi:hypothetical protein
MGETALLDAFLACEIDNSRFHHAEHVHVAFALLKRHSFPEAVALFCASLKRIAVAGGNPGLYHETISVAFLSLIAERMGEGGCDYESFAAANPDLYSKTVLERWYPPARLNSADARRTFLLPEPCA